MFYCNHCLMPSTRPRITFNEDGICNACTWSWKKRTINWKERQEYFQELVNRHKYVYVPWSGGKDSIYVAYKVREFSSRIGVEPILITIVPHMETEIGKWNRENTCKDFQHVEIYLNDKEYRKLARKYFIEDGRPKHPWETALSAEVMKYVVDNNQLPVLLVYGEEGEAEYGGASRELERWKCSVDKEYLTKYYGSNKPVWKLPDDDVFDDIFMTQWSRFENWLPSKHGRFARSKGMRVSPIRNIGTYGRNSQLSDKLQDLHVYLAFLKFGFGRCTADVSIGIREGWMSRKNAVHFVEKHDHEFPVEHLEDYCDYFDMTTSEFLDVLDKHANKEILVKDYMGWRLKDVYVAARTAGLPG